MILHCVMSFCKSLFGNDVELAFLELPVRFDLA